MESPEYEALNQCSTTLLDCIQQSPSDIVDKLKPSGLLAPGVLSFLGNPKHDDSEKAKKIIDVMTKQVKFDSQVFHIFVSAMKAAGPWTEGAVNILENKYKALQTSTSHSEQPTDSGEGEQLPLGGSDSTTQAQAAPISDILLPQSLDLERKYVASLFYRRENPWKIDMYFVITLNLEVHFQLTREYFDEIGAEEKSHMGVQFKKTRTSQISLNIPMEGVSVGEWKLLPMDTPRIFQSEVDFFKPGKPLRCIRLIATLPRDCKKKIPVCSLLVTLEGAVGSNHMYIVLDTFNPKTEEQQQYHLKKLDELITDKDTIDIQCLKVFLVGPPGVGKTTTLKRLLKTIKNIRSDGDNYRSTLLADCMQVLVFATRDGTEWLSSEGVDEEAKMVFGCCLHGSKSASEEETVQSTATTPKETGHSHPQQLPADSSKVSRKFSNYQSTNKQSRLMSVRIRLQELIKLGDYSEIARLVGDTLLNINDIGGQPGFLEMLPALSTGPAMYLVFLDLSKELGKPYEIPFSRDATIITPFKAMHTVEATISQILSAITSIHSFSHNPSFPKAATVSKKFKNFQSLHPVAGLIGTHKDKLKDPENDIKQINEVMKNVTEKYSDIIVSSPNTSSSLFLVDNYEGTEQSDIGSIREFMTRVFQSHFKKACLPIHPKWLIFGTMLRIEYKIVKMEDCLEIGQMLEMDKDETELCLWYLDLIGTLMHYTTISDDEDNWFKDRVICTPQVIFDSVSQLIVASLRTLHSEGHVIEKEREELLKKGQFSIESVEKYCLCEEVTDKLKQEELIPAKQLVRLLNHVNLLSPIIHKKKDVKRITYFMPAVLECALPDELTPAPPPDTDNPEPLFITFECGYVPTGTFCGLITQVVSRGPHGILGLEWELVEDSVKRNCVSFYIESVNKVTLICHAKCYEIRVSRSDDDISLHDLCTHVLTVILYIIKNLYEKLVPQLAFYCACPEHSICRDSDKLCLLRESQITLKFMCERRPVTLRSTQQVWLGKHVALGSSAKLEVLKFKESGDDFSFHWTKVTGPKNTTISVTSNELSIENICEEDFGYYRCEVVEAGKVVLTLYRALYRQDSIGEKMTTDVGPPMTGKPHDSNEIQADRIGRKRTSDVDPLMTAKHPKLAIEVQTDQTAASGSRSSELVELCSRFKLKDDDIKKEVSDKHILKIYHQLEKWKQVAAHLDLTQADVEAVESKARSNEELMRLYMLQKWKEKKTLGGTASYQVLLEALISCTCSKSAVQVGEMLSTHIS